MVMVLDHMLKDNTTSPKVIAHTSKGITPKHLPTTHTLKDSTASLGTMANTRWHNLPTLRETSHSPMGWRPMLKAHMQMQTQTQAMHPGSTQWQTILAS